MFWSDAADDQQFLEEPLLFGTQESEQGDLVFPYMGVDVQGSFGAIRGESSVGRDRNGNVVADTAALHDCLVGMLGYESSAKMSNHCEDCTTTREEFIGYRRSMYLPRCGGPLQFRRHATSTDLFIPSSPADIGRFLFGR